MRKSIVSALAAASIFFTPFALAETGKIFGQIDSKNIDQTALTPAEKNSLYEAQLQVYRTAEKILENHYIENWFVNYQIKNKFKTIADAQKDFYKKNIKVSKAEIKKILQENAQNPQLLEIPEKERESAVQQYLESSARSKLLNNIIQKAKEMGQIKLLAYEKPLSEKITFKIPGYTYNAKLKSAPVTIVEFADYQCPFCVQYNPEIEKILDVYKDKIQFVYYDFPLLDKHPMALPAAVAAKCAGNQGKYWEMHHYILSRPVEVEISNDFLAKGAQKINLNMTQFNTCLKDKTQHEKVLDHLAEGTRVGVSATPTLYINGFKFDEEISFENLKAAIEKDLPKK